MGYFVYLAFVYFLSISHQDQAYSPQILTPIGDQLPIVDGKPNLNILGVDKESIQSLLMEMATSSVCNDVLFI